MKSKSLPALISAVLRVIFEDLSLHSKCFGLVFSKGYKCHFASVNFTKKGLDKENECYVA